MFKEYAQFYDNIYGQKNYLAEVENLKNIFIQASPHFSGDKIFKKVLEIGCGTGGHAQYFLDFCQSYTGLDLSGEMIEQASLKLKNTNTPTSFYVFDLSNAEQIKGRDVIFENKKFDLALSLFHVFSYLIKEQQIDCFLRNIHYLLERKGFFIFDFWNSAGVNHLGLQKRSKEVCVAGGKIIRDVTPVLTNSSQVIDILIDIKMFNNEQKLVNQFQEKHPMRIFTPDEVSKKIESYGFKLEMIVGEGKNDRNKLPDHNDWGAMAVIYKV